MKNLNRDFRFTEYWYKAQKCQFFQQIQNQLFGIATKTIKLFKTFLLLMLSVKFFRSLPET